MSFLHDSGTRATRRSPGAVSRGTTMRTSSMPPSAKHHTLAGIIWTWWVSKRNITDRTIDTSNRTDTCMLKIRFQGKLTAIGSHTILRLPAAASTKIPSRGMSMVEGTFNGHAFQAPLEPDGVGSHWFRVSNAMLKAARAKVGGSVSVALEPM